MNDVARVTRASLRDELVEIVDEACESHTVDLTDHLRHLTFRRPDTTIYRCDFRIEGRFLFVYGDVGESVYEWSQKLEWEFLAGCNLGYFAGKCRASPAGEYPLGWDADLAEANLRTWWDEMSEDEDIDDPLPWSEYERWVVPSLTSRDEWIAWCWRDAFEWLGPWVGGIGTCDHPTVVWHWRMLQLALAKLGIGTPTGAAP